MLLYGLRNWTVDGQNQNIHCKQVCLAVAMVVAVEILAAAKRGVPPSIGIGGFLLAPLSALESFWKSKLKTFVEAFGPWFGVVDEELDVLLASDLMQGGVEKIIFFFFCGCEMYQTNLEGSWQACRCEGLWLQQASKLKPTLCWVPGLGSRVLWCSLWLEQRSCKVRWDY